MNRLEPNTNARHTALRRIIQTAAVFLLAFFLLLSGTSAVSRSSGENQAESIRLAILRSAVHCYAMKGQYPESLSYIQEHYGIRWDEDTYVVHYEITASNRMPSVMVIAKF